MGCFKKYSNWLKTLEVARQLGSHARLVGFLSCGRHEAALGQKGWEAAARCFDPD